MLRIILLSIIIGFTHIGISQNQELSTKPLFRSTEVIVTELQDSILQNGLMKDDSLHYFLDKWESIVGRNEAIERVKILQAIALNRFDKKKHTYYYKHFITSYHYRVNSAIKDDYAEIYDEYKAFLNFVPLNSKFDVWTKCLSKDLLPHQLKGSDAYLLCLLFTDNLDAFDDALRSKKYKTSKVKTTYINSPWLHRRTEGLFKIYAGHWLPIGKLSQDFSQSLSLGFSFGVPIKLNYRAECKIQVATSPKKSALEFRFDDILHKTSELSIVSGGIKFIKEHKISKHLFFDTSAEVNIGLISTDIKDPDGEKENSTHGVETIDLGLGIGFKRFLGNYNAIGIETVLHIAPYNFNNQLVSESGYLFLSTSMFFSF